MSQLILGPLVGGLNDRSALIWARANGPCTLHAWLGHRPDLSDAALQGASLPLTGDSGFAGVVPITGLSPEQNYFYTITLEPVPPPVQPGYPFFTTFPPSGVSRSFSFAFGSCFLPEDENGGHMFARLNALRRVRAGDPNKALRFMFLIGDQIYADDDVHNGLAAPDPITGKPVRKIALNLEDYRKVYAYTWSRPAFQDLLPHLPAFMTLDDHEVDDDWTWMDFNRTMAKIPIWNRVLRKLTGHAVEECCISRERVRDALQAYWEHQAMHAQGYIHLPELTHDDRYTLVSDDEGSFAYAFNYGAAAFFVLDTRTRRVKKNCRQRTMLGDGQWQALESWLLTVKDAFPVKFIVTSCALFFRMWSDLPRDRWTGFPRERNRLLDLLACNGVEGVYLLTGDLHSAHAIHAELVCPDGRSTPIWEFCATPFEQSPNWLAKPTYLPLFSKRVRNQNLLFVAAEHNFGIVNVEFRENGRPKVSYELHRGGSQTPIEVDTGV